MDILKTQEVLALTIFKCKVCCRRLQPPIFQMAHGNVCGDCHFFTAFTNTKRNIEAETFLSKLYCACNFAENGCTYEGPFYKTCNHEQKCRFRSRKCPIGYQEVCEFEYANSDAIIEHIRSDHEEIVLIAENDYIEFRNPTELRPNLFYLLQNGSVSILLRTMFKLTKDRMYYIFYHFGQEVVSLALTINEWRVTLMTKHESEMCFKFDTQNCYKVASAECESLAKVRFPTKSKIEYTEDNVERGQGILGAICDSCCYMVEEFIRYCPDCSNVACYKCNSCDCCTRRYLINLTKAKVMTSFPCPNTGCQQIIGTRKYDFHRLYQCPFKVEICKEHDCLWSGCYLEYVKHRLEKHSLIVNDKNCYLTGGREFTNYFVNGDDLFIHKYKLTVSKNEFEIVTIKLTTPCWSDSHTWTIKVKTVDQGRSITLTGNYTISECRAKLNILNYYYNGGLLLETYVKRN